MFQREERGQLSYLMLYRTKTGEERLAYVRVDSLGTRLLARGIINQYITDQGGLSYRAVELEFTGSVCSIKGTNGSFTDFGFESAPPRRDFYLITP